MIKKFIVKGLEDYSCLPNGEMHIWAEEMSEESYEKKEGIDISNPSYKKKNSKENSSNETGKI